MKFRIVETTGDPDHVPCRWQADCGRFKYVIIGDGDTSDDTGVHRPERYISGLLGAGSDWLEMDSVSVDNTFDNAEKSCKAHLAGIVAELQKELT